MKLSGPGLKPHFPSPPQVKSLIFDQSGTYLALGGTDVQIYICKQWTEILHFTGEWLGDVCRFPPGERKCSPGSAEQAVGCRHGDGRALPMPPSAGSRQGLTPLDAVTTACLPSPEHSGLTTGVAFGHHAKFIASTGMDRSLKFYSL